MQSHRTCTLLFVAIEILSLHDDKKMPMAVDACLPRFAPASGVPFFWNLLFGQRGTDKDNGNDEPPVYDAEIEEKSHWTTDDWIVRHKYALERHNVTTQDGYQLQLHRLPRPGAHPILLVHGLLTSSIGWVLLGPGKSLAFMLYDKEYDVWLANLRGSTYGRNHIRLNASVDVDFWNYSFHEQGVHDLRAIIEHIRNESSFHQIILITHSQAFNAFLVLCATQPEYNERIVFMQALAPTAMLRNYVKFDAEDVRRVRKFIKTKTQAKSYELFPADFLRENCLKGSAAKRKECDTQMKTFAGIAQYPKSLNPLVYGQLLQGGSLKGIMHLQQIWKSGDFVAYDYDAAQNLVFYNSVNPYNYDLRQITVPMVLHFGATDAIATPIGVRQIYARLLDTIIGVYRVTAAKFNHYDFFCANELKTLINDKLIDIMEKYFAGTLKYIIE